MANRSLCVYLHGRYWWTVLLPICVASGLYLFVLHHYQSLSYRDPTSFFFDHSRAYERHYSTRRITESQNFLSASSDAPTPRRLPWEDPILCVGIVTVRRREDQYVGLTLASLLDGLNQSERNNIYINLFFADTDPLQHPAFAEKWAETLPDRLLTYSRDHPEFTKLQAWERDGYYQNKSVNDYKHLMNACYETGAKYIAMIEDDTLAVKGWLGPTLQALNVVEQRTSGHEWIYLRLFYTESLLGWNSEEWPQYLFWSFVVWASSTAAMIAARKWLKAPNLLASSIVWTTMWPIPSGVHVMNKYGCCSQGLIFPHFIIRRVLDLVNSAEDLFVDMMLENIADSEGLSRFAVVPSILQHIGATSSKGYGFDFSATSLWNFRFEEYSPSGI
ncbi:hypothetical protein FE257_002826 [Aspergillus nanangensis]|uniref:Integral membrane protein n=1 Tax=Aspergillus nanangensis TaxID=2582783 RepID=A0AAD4CC68_ASPNN|nr:hypothetical protein FE257_002826 [Aspergillus nanangensis]